VRWPPIKCAWSSSNGVCGRTGIYAIKCATAADTFDVGTDFKVIKRAGSHSLSARATSAQPTAPRHEDLVVEVVSG
jgi:hypothetical protein